MSAFPAGCVVSVLSVLYNDIHTLVLYRFHLTTSVDMYIAHVTRVVFTNHEPRFLRIFQNELITYQKHWSQRGGYSPQD